MSFVADSMERRTRKNTFYRKIDQIIDWKPIEEIITEHDTRGSSAVGRAAYPGLLLFKMLLLGMWNDLSDYGVEDMVNDSMGASNFCGLIVEDDVPDHSVLSRFRTAMTKAGIFDRLLNEINRQLETRGIMIKKAVKVDASITRSPRKPRGIVDRTDSDECAQSDNKSLEREPEKFADRVDTDMRWTKKNGEFHFGAKKHCLADDNGLMVAVETTPDAWASRRRSLRPAPANVHDSTVFETLLDKGQLDENVEVQADKGYTSTKNRAALKKRKLKDGIMWKVARAKKGEKKKQLTAEQKLRNKEIQRGRYKIERTFGGMHQWFGGGRTRYVGITKAHTQHLLSAIAYNLKRVPKILELQKQGKWAA